MCIAGEDMHSRRGCAFLLRHIPISGEDESQWHEHPHGNAHPHREWGCASLRMGMCLIGNAHLTVNGDAPRREWRCVSPEMHILAGNAYHHQECT